MQIFSQRLAPSHGQTGNVEQSDIDRKKQLAEVMKMMSMQQNPQFQAGGNAIVAALAPIMQALAAKKTAASAKTDQEALTGQQEADYQRIVQAFQGTPEVPPSGAIGSEGSMGTPSVPGGREALMQALLTAQDPKYRQAGLAQAMQPPPKPTETWTQEKGPRGSLVQRNSLTGEMKQVVGQESPQIVLNGMQPKLSPTVQKEILETDELVQSSENINTLLDEALTINKSAYSGPYAKERATAMSWLPGENQSANDTIQIDNIMTGQALESLKAIFGGMPTEGERKILLDMQASPSKTPKQREDIIKRAKAAADRRITFNKNKAKSLREGTYFRPTDKPAETAPMSIDDLLKKY